MGRAQEWQKRALSLIRVAQPGQMVWRSLSCRVKSDWQKAQDSPASARAAPQEEQRTTAASCDDLTGTFTSSPQPQ
jgi:hypothetical protein